MLRLHIKCSSTQTNTVVLIDKKVQVKKSDFNSDKSIETTESATIVFEKYSCIYCGFNIVSESHCELSWFTQTKLLKTWPVSYFSLQKSNISKPQSANTFGSLISPSSRSIFTSIWSSFSQLHTNFPILQPRSKQTPSNERTLSLDWKLWNRISA